MEFATHEKLLRIKQKIKELAGRKKMLIIIGIVILVLLPVFLMFQKNGSPANQKWQEYSSDTLGFSISYPAEWAVTEEATESGPDILISDKNGLAFIRIRGLFDPYLNSAEAITASIAKYKDMLSSQQGVALAHFRTEEVNGGIGGFYASGEFTINDIAYRYEERGRLSTQGRVLIMRAADEIASFENSLSVMQKIMNGFILQ